MPFDSATFRRYLQALEVMQRENPVFANRVLRDLSDKLVSAVDYMEPLITAPKEHLTPDERRLRYIAEQLRTSRADTTGDPYDLYDLAADKPHKD